MPSLEQVLAPVRALPPERRAFAARMLLRLERRLASAAAYLHPVCRPRGPAEGLADQDRLLATWLAAYYAGVSATPDVLRGDMLEPLIARSGCAEPFCGPAAGGSADDDGGRLRFGLPSKPEARCDTRSELLRAAAAAIVALHAYLNYPRRGKDAMPPDETVVALTTLVIKSLAPPAGPPPPPPSSGASDGGASSSSGGGAGAEAEAEAARQKHAEAVARLDAELADLGLLPSCRALLAAAGVRLKKPEGGDGDKGGEEGKKEGGGGDDKKKKEKEGGGAKDDAAAAAATTAAAADAEAEEAEAADAAAAAAADAARQSGGSAAAAATAAAADGDGSGGGGGDPPLPGVPSLAAGSSATSYEQLEALPPLKTSHVRWLMHWARGRVLATMADVALAVDPEGDAATRRAPPLLAAAQRDALGMVSALPAHPAGYSLFAALAMRGQQFRAAVPFLRRGLAVARAGRDDAAVSRMCFQLAAALLLGGGGSAPTDPSRPLPVALGDVLALCDAGDAAAAACAGWWPQGAFGPCPSDGEPERSVVWAKLLPAVAAREGVAAAAAFSGAGGEEGDGEEGEGAAAALAQFLAETEAVVPLEGLAWVSPPPSTVPPGAVLVDSDDNEAGDGGGEGGEGEAAAAGGGGGNGAKGKAASAAAAAPAKKAPAKKK